jgi:hypothetical protein
VTADVVDLQTKFAVAKAESQALTGEMNKLARQAAQAGGQMSNEMKAGLTQAAEAAVKAKSEMQGFQNQMRAANDDGHRFSGVVGGMKDGLQALGIAFSIGAVVQFGRAVAENAAHIAHEAEVLQLSVTAYQAFREAAIDTGVDVETADTAIQRFSKNVSEAAVGTGPAAKALLEMGISANQSKEAILQEVSAFMVHASAVERDRYATELFGRTGAEMMPLFGQWAQGVEALTAKYDAMGRMISPETAERMRQADIQWKESMETLKVASAGPIATATSALAGLLSVMEKIVAVPTVKPGEGFFGGIARNFGFGSAPTSEAATPFKFPKPMSQDEEIKALDAYDEKARERNDLTLKHTKLLELEAKYQKEGHSQAAAKAAQEAADVQKQLDSLNKKKTAKGDFANAGDEAISNAQTQISDIKAAPGGSAEEKGEQAQLILADLLDDTRLNAKQRNDVEKELDREIIEDRKAVSQQSDQIAREDMQMHVNLAKQKFEATKATLDQEFSAHKITAQQKYDATIQALNQEATAQKAAQQQIIDSDVTSVTQKHAAANQIVEINAQTNSQLAAAARQLTADLKEEDNKRFESWRAVDSAITSAEGQLVNDIFTKRQGLGRDLAEIGEKMLEQEIADDLKALTERELVNLGMLASDKETSQEGLLFKLTSLVTETARTQAAQTAQTGAVAAGEAARSAAKAAGSSSGTAALASQASQEITQDAGRAAAAVYANLAQIPIVGPIIAPIGAGAAFAAVEAFGSFDQGVNVVPADMIAQVHAGERIMPAADNSAIISALNGGGGGAGDVHLNYNAAARAGANHETDAREMVRIIKRAVRSGELRF